MSNGFYIDLGAEKLIAAEKGNEKIAVEVKSFIGASETTEFSTALGQFLKHQFALEETEPDRKLYLAVPNDVAQSFFSLELPCRSVELPCQSDRLSTRNGGDCKMADVEKYRQFIQEILTDHSQYKALNEEVKAQLIFDLERGAFGAALLFAINWFMQVGQTNAAFMVASCRLTSKTTKSGFSMMAQKAELRLNWKNAAYQSVTLFSHFNRFKRQFTEYAVG